IKKPRGRKDQTFCPIRFESDMQAAYLYEKAHPIFKRFIHQRKQRAKRRKGMPPIYPSASECALEYVAKKFGENPGTLKKSSFANGCASQFPRSFCQIAIASAEGSQISFTIIHAVSRDCVGKKRRSEDPFKPMEDQND